MLMIALTWKGGKKGTSLLDLIVAHLLGHKKMCFAIPYKEPRSGAVV